MQNQNEDGIELPDGTSEALQIERGCRSHIPLCFLFWAAIMAFGISYFITPDESSPGVNEPAEESVAKKAINRTDLFRKDDK